MSVLFWCNDCSWSGYGETMKAKAFRKKYKTDSPAIGNYLWRYVRKNTCRKWKRNVFSYEHDGDIVAIVRGRIV